MRYRFYDSVAPCCTSADGITLIVRCNFRSSCFLAAAKPGPRFTSLTPCEPQFGYRPPPARRPPRATALNYISLIFAPAEPPPRPRLSARNVDPGRFARNHTCMAKLPPANSTVAEAYLHPATAQLLRELLASRMWSVGDLAQRAGLPVPTLRDAMNGKCPLAVGLWKEIASALNATQTEFSFTSSERDGRPCWELYCVLM